MAKFVVTAYIHKRDKNYTGQGSASRMIYEEYEDEPTANRRAKALVETGPALWATYEKKKGGFQR